jgi:hypothetical protein
MRTTNSLTGRARRFLMLKEVKMKKATLFKFGPAMELQLKSGMLSTSIKQRAHKPRVSTKTLDSMSIDHSILSQNFLSEEWLSALVLTMSK